MNGNDEYQCRECSQSKPIEEFMNYNAQSTYGTTCRVCRTSMIPYSKKNCTGCGKTRKLDAFVGNPREGVYQDILCCTCRRNIERTWSSGRWLIEGFTSLPSRGSHSFVRCDDCHQEMDRRRVLGHRCM